LNKSNAWIDKRILIAQIRITCREKLEAIPKNDLQRICTLCRENDSTSKTNLYFEIQNLISDFHFGLANFTHPKDQFLERPGEPFGRKRPAGLVKLGSVTGRNVGRRRPPRVGIGDLSKNQRTAMGFEYLGDQ
jgi:hypothetical protein